MLQNLIAAVLVGLVCALAIFVDPEIATITVAALVGVTVVVCAGVILSRPRDGAKPETKVEAAPVVPTGPPNLQMLILASIGVRLLGAVVFNITDFNIKVAPDSEGYIYYGKLIARAWADPSFILAGRTGYNPRSFYQHLNAFMVYYVGGDVGMMLSFVNAFIATWAAWLISRLTFHMYGPVAARRAFLLAAFFPSIVLWTSINLRDSWSFLLMAGALLNAYLLREKFTRGRALLLVLCIGCFPFVRAYMVPLIGLGILASYFAVRLRQLPTAIVSLSVMLVLLIFMAQRFGISTELQLEERLQTLQRLRAGLAYGRSAVDTSIDISTPTGAMLYLPRGVATFLLAPFPWRLNSWRQVMALPETLFWYVVLYQAGREAIRGVRKELSRIALPLFVFGIITVIYGLVEGNEGTAYRHRAHAVLIVFIFAAGDYARRRSMVPQGEPSKRPRQLSQVNPQYASVLKPSLTDAPSRSASGTISTDTRIGAS